MDILPSLCWQKPTYPWYNWVVSTFFSTSCGAWSCSPDCSIFNPKYGQNHVSYNYYSPFPFLTAKVICQAGKSTHTIRLGLVIGFVLFFNHIIWHVYVPKKVHTQWSYQWPPNTLLKLASYATFFTHFSLELIQIESGGTKMQTLLCILHSISQTWQGICGDGWHLAGNFVFPEEYKFSVVSC